MNDISSEKTDLIQEKEKAVFAQEQAHLSEVHHKLQTMEAGLEDRISSIAEKAAAEKLDIRENLALNFDGDSDSMETYIEFEVMNHAIDQYNIDRDTAAEKLGRVKRLLKAPYFAKVQLQFDPDEDPEEYYIGSTGVSENLHEPLVIDWRSPVAETYYNQDNGRTFYTVEDRRIDVDLLLRRQFELSEDRLHAFFDTQIAIEDPLLIRSLTRQRSDKMQAITATIQKEQNAVVRYKNVPVLLVNGIAGSGKTSVLLQRIAWLFYRQRDTLRPDEVVLMTLNPIFRRYIDQVLPDMGEMNPVSVTWKEFLAMAGVSRRRGSSTGSGFRTLPDSLHMMEE
jgi:DNA helicase-2/ATP-dependent DNA helicase PcrA